VVGSRAASKRECSADAEAPAFADSADANPGYTPRMFVLPVECVLAVVVTCVAPALSSPTDLSALERYEAFIAAVRGAETLEFDAEVINVRRQDDRVRARFVTRFEAALARGDRGWIRRTRVSTASADATEGEAAAGQPQVLVEICADGDVAYQIDRDAGAYVRTWPPRFLANTETRGVIALREFLGESTETPLVVRKARHPKHPDLQGFELSYATHSEMLLFTPGGALELVIRVDSEGDVRTTFTFRSFALGQTAGGDEFTRSPPNDFEDLTLPFARTASFRFEPAPPPENSVGNPPPALLTGATDVDAPFIDRTRALSRLRAMRGRPILLVFLDRDAPLFADTLRRLRALADDAERRQLRAQFIGVFAKDPPASERRDPKNLRFVKPLRDETERAFGVLHHPTSFVIDRDGVVIHRSAVMFDEPAIRTALGL
jgi:hypothetical protein